MTEELLRDSLQYRFQDVDGRTRVLRPAERARPTTAQLPLQAATEFLTENAAELGIQAGWLSGAGMTLTNPEGVDTDAGIELRIDREKRQFDTRTVVYQQTWNGIPVWRRGAAVTLKTDPARIVGCRSTCFTDITVEGFDKVKVNATVTGARGLMARSLSLDEAPLSGGAVAHRVSADDDKGRAHIVRNRVVVYQYDAATRLHDGTHDDGDEHGLPLPFDLGSKVPEVKDGAFRICREVTFSIPTPPKGRVVWLALIDIETRDVLYVRPFSSNADGFVFDRDPGSQGSTATPESDSATLNMFRSSRPLLGLDAPAPGEEQALVGEFVEVDDFEIPTIPVPTEPAGTDFNYDARSNDFAAVNAYAHSDSFFRLVEDLGFSVADYFGSTTFPTPVDHRGRFQTTDGIEINGSCSGNGMFGILETDFELASLTDTSSPIGLATDVRVVLHEFGGHGVLYPHVNWANFGFAHSAGDSFAAVLSDPESQAADRFETFPFVASIISRRHDRDVTAGWAWGGSNDTGGYSSESILCTTHFRLYRSLGGDSGSLTWRRFAARATSYLMLRGIGTLSDTTNPANAEEWFEALMEADAGDWTSEGLAGGAYGKVIRWAFEKQGLFQPPGAATPVVSAGAPPAVDVFIDDGRNGEYTFQPVHYRNPSVWNRNTADGGLTHLPPILGQQNFCYVRVKNRGTETAENVTVDGFHCDPGTGLTWPNDWIEMETVSLSAPDIPSGGEVIVGPFTWTPTHLDHECLLMIARADGDPSNVDQFAPGETIEEWRLVPNDNNIGQRNVKPVPGEGTGIASVLSGSTFTVRNSFDHRVRILISETLPDVMVHRGWRLSYASPGGNAFSLAAGQSREVKIVVHEGAPITRDDVRSASDRDVIVSVEGDGIGLGGMVYFLDPDLELEPGTSQDDDGLEGDCDDPCTEPANELLKCLNLPGQQVDNVRVRGISVEIDVSECD